MGTKKVPFFYIYQKLIYANAYPIFVNVIFFSYICNVKLKNRKIYESR